MKRQPHMTKYSLVINYNIISITLQLVEDNNPVHKPFMSEL